MLIVRLITDPFDLSVYEEHKLLNSTDLLAFLQDQFPEWPPTARLYIDTVATANEITPQTDTEAELLRDKDGLYYVVVYPADPLTLALIALAAVVVLALAVYFLTPRINGSSVGSANNSLGARTNQARPNERIPDPFGQIISIPDLLGQPYRAFKDNVEYEISYMCIGRGQYDITDVRDGTTPLSDIGGSTAVFYGPGTSPNSGVPQMQIGTDIEETLVSVARCEPVTGQTLKPPNYNRVQGDNDIKFVGPDTIILLSSTERHDFTGVFEVGDVVTIGNADFGGASFWETVLEEAKFYPDKTIVFTTFDPSSIFIAGESITITGAVFTGLTTGGDPITVDLSGVYLIDTVSSTTLALL